MRIMLTDVDDNITVFTAREIEYNSSSGVLMIFRDNSVYKAPMQIEAAHKILINALHGKDQIISNPKFTFSLVSTFN